MKVPLLEVHLDYIGGSSCLGNDIMKFLHFECISTHHNLGTQKFNDSHEDMNMAMAIVFGERI